MSCLHSPIQPRARHRTHHEHQQVTAIPRFCRLIIIIFERLACASTQTYRWTADSLGALLVSTRSYLYGGAGIGDIWLCLALNCLLSIQRHFPPRHHPLPYIALSLSDAPRYGGPGRGNGKEVGLVKFHDFVFLTHILPKVEKAEAMGQEKNSGMKRTPIGGGPQGEDGR